MNGSTDSEPLFSVSEFTTWHQTFEQDIALYSQLGIKGIEICERKLSPDMAVARDQLKTVRDAGLRITSVQPRVHALYKDGMCPELDDPIERVKRYRGTIDLFSSVFPGENLPMVTITGAAPNHDFRAAHALARSQYRLLADYAADKGVRVMYEPLSPVLMNVDTFICNLTEALQLIQDVDRADSFGLMLDIWHIWREPDIYRRVSELKKVIFGVHICDWPADEPRHFGDRVLPGEGVIDLPAMLGAIDASGYRDAYCLEIFSLDHFHDSLWQQNAADVIRRGRDGFEKAWISRKNASSPPPPRPVPSPPGRGLG
jgi:sugar phosphate isomerase/epimerase